MTSGDNTVDTSRLEFLLREHFAQTDRQIAEMKAISAQMKADNAEFHALILKEFHDFAEKQEAKFDAFAEKQEAKFDAFAEKQEAKFDAFTEKQEAKFDAFTEKIEKKFEAVDKKFEAVQSQVADLQISTEGLRHDVAGLYHWDYWLLSLIIAAIAMPHILEGIKQLVGTLFDGISGNCSSLPHLFNSIDRSLERH